MKEPQEISKDLENRNHLEKKDPEKKDLPKLDKNLKKIKLNLDKSNKTNHHLINHKKRKIMLKIHQIRTMSLNPNRMI